MRPTLAPTPLEMLVGSISAQQVNLQFAFACRARLVRRYGTPVRVGRDTVWAFPDPATLARVGLREFRSMKFSRRKGEYIRDLARAVVAGRLDLDALGAEAHDREGRPQDPRPTRPERPEGRAPGRALRARRGLGGQPRLHLPLRPPAA